MRLLGFAFSYLIVSIAIGALMDAHNSDLRLPAGKAVRPDFLVMVVSRSPQGYPHRAMVIPFAGVRPYAAKTDGWSFCVPAGSETELTRQLRHPSEPSPGDQLARLRNLGIVSFRARQLAGGKQRIVLKSDDGIDRACYIASSHSIAPIYYSQHLERGRPAFYLFGAQVGIFVNAALWLLIWGIARASRAVRRRLQTPAG